MLQAELKVLGGKHQGKAIPLNLRRFLVGREQDCHLRPNSESVSRHHCVFAVDDYGIRLRDLGSTNGTRVNGEIIRHETVLKDGDQIQIGKLVLQLSLQEVAAFAAEKVETDLDVNAALVVSGSDDIPSQAGNETSYDLPAYTAAAEQTATNLGADTEILNAAQPGYPQGMPHYPGYPMQMPPGYPMMPTYPGYPPGYPMGYAPPMPGYPIGYPPMQGWGQEAQPQAQPATGTVPKEAANAIPVRLPPPESTGAKEPQPAAAAPTSAAGSEEKPSTSAADIIKSYMQRRNTR